MWDLKDNRKVVNYFGFLKIRQKNMNKGKCLSNIRGAYNKFPDFFVQAFKIVEDAWKFSMLLQ